jgi:hypothetical protein
MHVWKQWPVRLLPKDRGRGNDRSATACRQCGAAGDGPAGPSLGSVAAAVAVNAALEQACRRLAEEDINVTVVERDGVLYANVHATVWSEQHTWLRIFQVFGALSYCVQIR